MKDNNDNTTELDENNAVEIFEKDSIITLHDEQDNPIEFYEIASIEYNEKFYALLQPVELIEGMSEDEAVIFEYSVEEGSTEKKFNAIFDEELLNEVFSVYLRAVADCECDGCAHSCEDDCACESACECGQDCDCGKEK